MSPTRCGCFIQDSPTNAPVFLPQVAVKAHIAISSSTFRASLSQTFVNPQKDVVLEQVKYVFPLYDGVSVVAFDCHIGDRSIKGVVKERQQAIKDYTEAKDQGRFAGLTERAPDAGDVFTTWLGNIPAEARVRVEITFLGELKHDAEVDGLRFNLPVTVAPRYGDSDMLRGANEVVPSGMNIVVDAEMPYTIKSIQSPSHAISVNIGTTSGDPGADPSFNRASASLSTVASTLDGDFILQVVADKMGEPSAVLETHPTIAGERALMATFVPKFSLPQTSPEIVFVCDRSGSMSSRIEDLRRSLQIFLRSLPMGCKFNICSFGTAFSFLWPRSKAYNQESLDEASRHVATFQANFGGTKMYEPVEAAFAQRYTDLDLELFVLTDGQIAAQEALFKLIRDSVGESNHAVRVFSLGVGNDASTSLIEGVARAGCGMSQAVGNQENMDKKIVRMLRASLTPHIHDYSLEIKYEPATDDDFVLVDRMQDVLHLAPGTSATVAPAMKHGEPTMHEESAKKPISLYDTSIIDDVATVEATSAESRFDHLPVISTPTYIQAPSEVPPLFPFNRTTVYILLSDKACVRMPISVILRGTSLHGPLELEIPVTHLHEKSTTIHQLAARKAVEDLEGGRGWLSKARTDDKKLLNEVFDSHYSDMIEREAIRLGVKYQVGGKWCSFVAVEESLGEGRGSVISELKVIPPMSARRARAVAHGRASQPSRDSGRGFACRAPVRRQLASNAARKSAPSTGSVGRPAGQIESKPVQESANSDKFGQRQSLEETVTSKRLKHDPTSHPPGPAPGGAPVEGTVISGGDRFLRSRALQSTAKDDRAFVEKDTSSLDMIVNLQAFDGSWTWQEELLEVLGVARTAAAEINLPVHLDGTDRDTITATLCAVEYLKRKLMADKDSWEMVVEKAEQFLVQKTGLPMDELLSICKGRVSVLLGL